MHDDRMSVAGKLKHTVHAAGVALRVMSEQQAMQPRAPGKWNAKQTLGHLIDSACNNHQRFVRVQFEDVPRIGYDADLWNKFSYHESMEWSGLVSFWRQYNLHLADLIDRIPQEVLNRQCITGGEPVSLQWLIDDYVGHLEHHLRQIISYE